MKKISNAFAPAALILCFLKGFISCAYGHSLVFGPEFFSSEDGQPQRVVKSFPIQDVGRKFIVSVQGGASGEKGLLRGAVSINGKLVFPPAEMGKQPKMFSKRIKLQKKNKISVDLARGAAAQVIVTHEP